MGLCSLNNENEYKRKLSYLIDEKEEEINKSLGLKIHICGNLPEKDLVFNRLFNQEVDENYKDRASKQYKTTQFHWIAKIYEDLSKKTIESIKNEIIEDFDNIKSPISQNVILYFGEENINLLIETIKSAGDIYYPLFIIISNNEINIKFKDKRRITNIILNDITRNRLDCIISSILWKYDCYFNEKGNIISKYLPDNIFKTFGKSLSFYSINILLSGKSRAGKSRFVNYLTNKLNSLESCKKETVSKHITEYFIYLNNKENISEKSCIKLIDTPGIVSNQNNDEEEKDSKKCNKNTKKTIQNKKDKIEKEHKFSKELLSNLLNNFNNEMEIHFILFFFMEGESLEGMNEIFKLLNDCKRQVLFVINKATIDEDEDESKDVISTISFMKQRKLDNLTNKNNYFGINLERSKYSKDFGVNEIFKRIYDIFIENNKLTETNKEIKDIKNKIDKLSISFNNQKNPLEKMDIHYKDNFINEVNKLKIELFKNINIFKYMNNIKNIKNIGLISSNRCRNIINSLTNLTEIIEIKENKLPAISYFQAFMVKEIGEIFGLNLKEIQIEIKEYLNRHINNERNFEIKNSDKEKQIKINFQIIKNYLKSEIEKSNDYLIVLAKMFNNIRKERNNADGLNEYSKYQIDKELTNEIFMETIDFLMNFLGETNGLFFYQNYLTICQKLEKDLKYFSELNYEDSWGKKNMIIVKE